MDWGFICPCLVKLILSRLFAFDPHIHIVLVTLLFNKAPSMVTDPTKKKITSTTILPNGMRSTLSWDPDVDPVVEDRLRCMQMSDEEYWNSMMRLLNLNRTEPITFEKRIIKWT